jgi:GMP synthase (glutamine-hydrolysing)
VQGWRRGWALPPAAFLPARAPVAPRAPRLPPREGSGNGRCPGATFLTRPPPWPPVALRVVVVDNGGQWTHREWRVLKYLGVDARVVPNTTAPEALADADGVVLSGGAPQGVTLATMGACPQLLAKLPQPVLGICAGAQVMGLHYGGALAPAKQPEFGKATITLLDKSGGRILQGLPETSVVWESHNDEVAQVPPGFQVLARSDNCAMQAMEHPTLPRFAVQFHPEVEHTEHGERVFRNFLGQCRR